MEFFDRLITAVCLVAFVFIGILVLYSIICLIFGAPPNGFEDRQPTIKKVAMPPCKRCGKGTVRLANFLQYSSGYERFFECMTCGYYWNVYFSNEVESYDDE